MKSLYMIIFVGNDVKIMVMMAVMKVMIMIPTSLTFVIMKINTKTIINILH